MLGNQIKYNYFDDKCILIVDPVENIRLTLTTMVNTLGAQKTLQAKDGVEAKAVIEKEQIDLIISEYNLPKLDGCKLLKFVRQNQDFHNIPFLMVSATIEHQEVAKAIRHGVSEYLVKPFSRKLLKERMISAIETPIKSTFSHTTVIKSASESNPNKSDKLSVLIVDDVVDNLQLISDILRGDYNIQAAKSGIKALEICASERQPDIVLLDIKMPQMDGLEVCRRLKANPATQHITIIFITALGQTEDIVKGLELGAVDYLTKPINPPVLKARVKNHAILVKAHSDLRSQVDILVENIRLRDEFDRILQNDLNTPLDEMQNAIELTEKYSNRPEQVKHSSKALKQCHTQLSQHINNMVSLYKIEDGSYQFNPKPIQLNTIISDVIQAFSPTISSKTLEIDFDSTKPYIIQAEYSLTSSLFSNIFVNLIDEAPRGSAIKLTIEKLGNNTRLMIKTRAKLSPELKSQFFEKYISYGRKGSLGIGNYAAKIMIELQKGSISVESSEEQNTLVKLNFVSAPKS
jgi:CheY-like chemotaxis protein